MRGMFFRDALAAMAIFDLSKRTTFDSLDSWVQEARGESPDCLIVVIGIYPVNGGERVVSDKEIKFKCAEYDALAYFESSPLTGENMADAFHMIGKELLYLKLKLKSQLDNLDSYDIGSIRTLEIVMFFIDDRLCCHLTKKLGDGYCIVCGQELSKEIQPSNLDPKIGSIVYSKRWCCHLFGRRSEPICGMCGRDVPLELILNRD